MKQLIKKTLLATAVATICGTAFAGDLSVTKQVHSTEGLVGVTATQTSNVISYKLNAAYREGDKITFTFTPGTLDANAFPSVINMAPVNNDVEKDAIAGLTLGLLNTNTDAVTYRVTKLTLPTNVAGKEWQNGSTVGATLKLGVDVPNNKGVGYKVSSLANGGNVSVTVSSQTSVGDILDNDGTRTAMVAEAKSQFGTAKVVTPFDATIDVAQMRKAFVGGGADSMSYTITNPDTTNWLNLATVNATNGTLVTLTGEAGKQTGVVAANWTSGGTRTYKEADAKLTISYNGMVTNDTVTFTPTTGAKAVALETQNFTSKFEYNYTSAAKQAGSSLVGNLSAGKWELNGATVNIPYMPYGPNASQIIYVSNAGTQMGDISVTAFDDKGNMFDLGTLPVKAAPSRVTKIAPELNAILTQKGFKGSKASLTITVNAPEADITVYASYNIGGADRGYINTDQYKGKD